MNKIKYCPNCGNQLTPGSKFCEHCGQSLAAVREKKTADALVQWHRTQDFKRMVQVFLVSLIILLALNWQNIVAFFHPTTSVSFGSEGLGMNLFCVIGLIVRIIVCTYVLAIIAEWHDHVTKKGLRGLSAVILWLVMFLNVAFWEIVYIEHLVSVFVSGNDYIFNMVAAMLTVFMALALATMLLVLMKLRDSDRKVRTSVAVLLVLEVIIAIVVIIGNLKNIVTLSVESLCILIAIFLLKDVVLKQQRKRLFTFGKLVVIPFMIAYGVSMLVSYSHGNMRYDYQVIINRQEKIMREARKVKKVFAKCVVMVGDYSPQYYVSTHFRYDPSWDPELDNAAHQMVTLSDSRYKKDAKSGEVYFDVYDNGRNDDSADSGKKTYDETSGYYFIGKRVNPLTIRLWLTRSGDSRIVVYPAYGQHGYGSYGGKMHLTKYEGMQSLKGKLPSEDGRKSINVEFIGAE